MSGSTVVVLRGILAGYGLVYQFFKNAVNIFCTLLGKT
jgi:hypothetical protein